MEQLKKLKDEEENLKIEFNKKFKEISMKAMELMAKDSVEHTVSMQIDLADWDSLKYTQSINEHEIGACEVLAYIPVDLSDLYFKYDGFHHILHDYVKSKTLVRRMTSNSLSVSVGECLVVDYDGAVFDQLAKKWIIGKNDYSNDYKLTEMIEDYMIETDRYPLVFKETNRHGGLVKYSGKK